MSHSMQTTISSSRKLKFMRIQRSTLLEAIAAIFILLFTYTAISKFWNIPQFHMVLRKSPLVSNHALMVAWAMPFIEIIVSILLFIPRTRKIGLYSSLVLMIGFTSYLGYMIYFTPSLPCSCGGVLSTMTWKQHLVFNIFFTALAITGVLLQRRSTGRIVT